MPFVAEVDFYYDVMHRIPALPSPEASRLMEVEIAAFLNALPRDEMERCWRHWYRLHVNGEEPVALRADEPEVDEELARRWERMVRAAERMGRWMMEGMALHEQALPIVDVWVGFQEEGAEQRFKGSVGWWPRDRPGMERYR